MSLVHIGQLLRKFGHCVGALQIAKQTFINRLFVTNKLLDAVEAIRLIITLIDIVYCRQHAILLVVVCRRSRDQ